ncbi:hypothetical protein HanRHA438_Chr01g0032361 [Helianthus annuus]|nr:hypothetical protein HanRHA438_Chr01g0032361 [Helianthus annuus]
MMWQCFYVFLCFLIGWVFDVFEGVSVFLMWQLTGHAFRCF